MTVYCERTDIEDVFGIGNVASWADLDNDKSPVKIKARIERAIAKASARLEDELREDIYAVPFVGTSETLKDLCARIAGIWLYDNRGVQEYDPETGRVDLLSSHRKAVDALLSRIRVGLVRLPLTRKQNVSTVPQVVDIDDE